VARAVDWWCGGRDAKLDAELLLVGSAGPPRMALLGHDALRRVEREWLRYKAAVATHVEQLIDARARQAQARGTLARAETEVREEPTEEALARRVGGEERTAVGVIRDRRLAEHRRQAADLQARTRQLREELTAAQQELERVAAVVQHRFELAQARATTTLGYAFQRRLAYLSRLVRVHPQGVRIGELVTAELTHPEWTVAARSPDLGQP
jgi:hypothetical protein